MRLPRPSVLRPGEERPTLASFGFLAIFFASQAMLEAARDTLFLSKVPADHLPWMYIVIAVVSFVVARGEERLGRRMDSADALVAWAGVAAVGTGVLAFVLFGHGTTEGRHLGVYVTYVWSGAITSLVVSRFWALVGNMYSIIDAKRLYGLIGAGAVVGAIAGSGLAGLAAWLLPSDRLLIGSAAGFALAAAAAGWLRTTLDKHARAPKDDAAPPMKMLRALASLKHARYQQRVVLLIVLSFCCLTVADFAFKSAVATHVPRQSLGVFFGAVGVATNTLSLLVQLVIGPRLIGAIGVIGSLAVLPVLLALGGAGLAAGLGAVAAVMVRGADGSLRYSLHRTASELLFVPMTSSVRGAMKVLDVLGQRAGQAIASVALLVAASMSAPTWVVAALLVVLAVAWVAAVAELREHYLDIFRGHLAAGRLGESVRMRGLDQAALETLFATLDSGEDAEVIAALQVLAREKKGHLIPALILYHPSIEVAWRAMQIFIAAGRTSVVPTLDRLAIDAVPSRRALAIMSRMSLAPDRAFLERRLAAETVKELRAVLSFMLVRFGVGTEEDARAIVEDVCSTHSIGSRLLAGAIALDPAPTFDHVLVQMARSSDPEVRRVLPGLLGIKKTPATLDALIELIADEDAREPAVLGLVQRGEEGLAAVARALDDDETPSAIGWQLPRALTYFPAERALPVLLGRMRTAKDGMLRFRCLRALERLVALAPELAIPPQPLRAEIEVGVRRGLWCLSRRVALVEGAELEPARSTPVHELIVDLLHDKERHALDRVLRVLGLGQRGGDFAHVRRGLGSGDERIRASAVELLAHLLPTELRERVMALVSVEPDPLRLESAGDTGIQPSYGEVIDELRASGERAFEELAEYHLRELDQQPPPPPRPASPQPAPEVT